MKVSDELLLPRIYFKTLHFLLNEDDSSNVCKFFSHLLTFRDFLQILLFVVSLKSRANFPLCCLIASFICGFSLWD